MRTIYKYPLETTNLQSIKIPKLADEDDFMKQFLCIDTQNGYPCLWCLVDTSEQEREVLFRVVGTGNPMPEILDKSDYLGTYQLFNGAFIGHVFLEKELLE